MERISPQIRIGLSLYHCNQPSPVRNENRTDWRRRSDMLSQNRGKHREMDRKEDVGATIDHRRGRRLRGGALSLLSFLCTYRYVISHRLGPQTVLESDISDRESWRVADTIYPSTSGRMNFITSYHILSLCFFFTQHLPSSSSSPRAFIDFLKLPSFNLTHYPVMRFEMAKLLDLTNCARRNDLGGQTPDRPNGTTGFWGKKLQKRKIAIGFLKKMNKTRRGANSFNWNL